jgi:hypothetical protein
MLSLSYNSQNFIESEGSLPCSQDTATGPYSEPDESSPHSPIIFIQDQFSLLIFTFLDSNGKTKDSKLNDVSIK